MPAQRKEAGVTPAEEGSEDVADEGRSDLARALVHETQIWPRPVGVAHNRDMSYVELHPENPQARLVNTVVDLLERGGTIALPTDPLRDRE